MSVKQELGCGRAEVFSDSHRVCVRLSKQKQKVASALHKSDKKTESQDPKGQVEDWPLGLGFCFLGNCHFIPISSVQSLRHVQLCDPMDCGTRQASLSFTNSRSLLRLMSIESVMPPDHLILCRPLLLQPSFFPSIRVFSSESVLHIKRSKYWRFSFSINPSSEHSGPISRRIDMTV